MSIVMSPEVKVTPTNADHIERLIENMQRAVVTDRAKLELILAALIARGHLLLDDVPGIGKTLVAKSLARSIQATFKRIQCTPDLLPSDITGSAIFDQHEQRFEFVRGPVFSNVLLVDEVNRLTPRTQSSLLESMAESQVTADGFTYKLHQPFFVIATQNPVETAGTFPLPEAQLDRFLLALKLGYPGYKDELTILEREEHADPLDALAPVVTLADIQRLQTAARGVDVSGPIKEYIVQLVVATRHHPEAVLGVSPRGGVALQRASQALALLRNRSFVTPDDVKAVATAVMVHRILARDRRPEAGRAVVADVLQQVAVPLD